MVCRSLCLLYVINATQSIERTFRDLGPVGGEATSGGGGGGPQIGEATSGGSSHQSCECDQIKMEII